MEVELERCHYCGHENLKGFTFCSECRRARYEPPKPAWLCERCGNENRGFLGRCVRCGMARYRAPNTKPFPVRLEIHKNADIRRAVEDLAGPLDFTLEDRNIPSVEDFKVICWTLTDNEYQTFIRRFQLHRPGKQDLVSFREIAREKGGSLGTSRNAFKDAKVKLSFYFRRFVNQRHQSER